jgi:hypothetical protein
MTQIRKEATAQEFLQASRPTPASGITIVILCGKYGTKGNK